MLEELVSVIVLSNEGTVGLGAYVIFFSTVTLVVVAIALVTLAEPVKQKKWAGSWN